MPTGVNLNQYSGNGSFIPWHRDNECLFGSPFEPKVIVSMSLGHSPCSNYVVARRRTLPFKFGWIMVTYWSWMV